MSRNTAGICWILVACTAVLASVLVWRENRLVSSIDQLVSSIDRAVDLTPLRSELARAQEAAATRTPCMARWRSNMEGVIDLAIRDKVMAMIVEQLGVDDEEVTDGASFVGLGADVPDMVELTMALEEEFRLEFRDEDIGEIRRVWEIVDYISRKVSPPRIDGSFLMPIEDVFSISGRGTVVTGRVERGKVVVGEEIEIVGFTPTQKKVVTGVEMFRKPLDAGVAGDNIGVLLRGTERDEVERGQVLAKPKSITPHTVFRGDLYLLTPGWNGRWSPISSGYRPQFSLRTTDVTGEVQLPDGVERVMPGDNATITVELTAPMPLENGLRFLMREGGRPVGCGIVTEIIN